MSKIKLALSLFTIILGIFLIVYGEYDNSPGGQLLGLVISAAGILNIVKSIK